MKINWKQKLSSRKFWSLVAALVVTIVGGVISEEVAAKVSGIIGAAGSCIVYILAEATVDAGRDAKAYTWEDEEDG